MHNIIILLAFSVYSFTSCANGTPLGLGLSTLDLLFNSPWVIVLGIIITFVLIYGTRKK